MKLLCGSAEGENPPTTASAELKRSEDMQKECLNPSQRICAEAIKKLQKGKTG